MNLWLSSFSKAQNLFLLLPIPTPGGTGWVGVELGGCLGGTGRSSASSCPGARQHRFHRGFSGICWTARKK